HTSEPRQSRPPAKSLPVRVSTRWPRLRRCSPCEYAPAIRRGSRLASGAISSETRLMRGPASACQMLRQAATAGELAAPLAQVGEAQDRIDEIVVGRQLERVHAGLAERRSQRLFALFRDEYEA